MKEEQNLPLFAALKLLRELSHVIRTPLSSLSMAVPAEFQSEVEAITNALSATMPGGPLTLEWEEVRLEDILPEFAPVEGNQQLKLRGDRTKLRFVLHGVYQFIARLGEPKILLYETEGPIDVSLRWGNTFNNLPECRRYQSLSEWTKARGGVALFSGVSDLVLLAHDFSVGVEDYGDRGQVNLKFTVSSSGAS